ncbi:MAG: DNA alkylation repair protein [Campylobacterota bacterium]|nr:DNA alkylation repair protein [Campylobacterota bacterium]
MKHSVVNELKSYANSDKISDCMRFFKTGKGEYGEGDQFLGIKVPDIRKVVKKHYSSLSLNEIQEFLYSPYHEHRMFALLVLVALYQSKRFDNRLLPKLGTGALAPAFGEAKAITSNEFWEKSNKATIYHFYINHTAQINNWDLIDVTCPHIVGVHLLNRDRSILYRFARSNHLWERRIAIITTFAFIKAGEFEDTFAIADILLKDTHDLIHKAVGWAIRTVGNKNLEAEIEYLNPRYKQMPRTMLRYAIEKFDEPLRLQYLRGEI